MKKLMSLVFVVAIAITAMAQEKKVVEVDNQTFDFGTVQEEVGKITHVFNFSMAAVWAFLPVQLCSFAECFLQKPVPPPKAERPSAK